MAKRSGFTLIELLTVVVILGVLATVALPSFTRYFMRLECQKVEHLLVVINYAQLTSMALAKNVYVCGLGESKQCSKNWSESVVVFTDDDNSNSYTQNDQLLYQLDLHLKYGSLVLTRAASASYLKFNWLTGYAIGSNGTIRYCTDDARYNHAVIVSDMGRARLAQDYNKDGMNEEKVGVPVKCS